MRTQTGEGVAELVRLQEIDLVSHLFRCQLGKSLYAFVMVGGNLVDLIPMGFVFLVSHVEFSGKVKIHLKVASDTRHDSAERFCQFLDLARKFGDGFFSVHDNTIRHAGGKVKLNLNKFLMRKCLIINDLRRRELRKSLIANDLCNLKI